MISREVVFQHQDFSALFARASMNSYTQLDDEEARNEDSILMSRGIIAGLPIPPLRKLQRAVLLTFRLGSIIQPIVMFVRCYSIYVVKARTTDHVLPWSFSGHGQHHLLLAYRD